MKKTKPIKRRRYKSNERRERLRIFELYDGPATDTVASIKHMELIHQWIKSGRLPSLIDVPADTKKLRLIDKNP